MISDRVFVYLQLPGTLELVTAAYYRLDPGDGVPMGTDAVPLEPFELPLGSRKFTTVKLKGIFGALRDALPDAWGRRVIERELGRMDLDEADLLLHSPDDRAG